MLIWTVLTLTVSACSETLPLKMLRLTLYEIVKEQKIFKSGQKKSGPERARTADPLLAKQVLYQLSYRPESDLFSLAESISSQKKWWAEQELHL